MSKKTFHFRVEDKLYSLKHSSLPLIPYFNTIVQMNPTEALDEENAVDVPLVSHNGFKINTKKLFDIIVRYVLHWESKTKKEAYVKEDRVPEGFVHQILHPFDLKLIEEYIDGEIEEVENSDHTNNVYVKIAACNLLLAQVDAYLHMSGFANKIYAYIVCLLRECFIDDVEKVANDEYFSELQSRTDEYWEDNFGYKYNRNGEKVGGKD